MNRKGRERKGKNYSDIFLEREREKKRKTLVQGQEIFLYSVRYRLALVSILPHIQLVTADLCPLIKQPERAADYSLPCSSEVKNYGAIFPFFHTFQWRGP
jgi:hypothetical protein